MRVGLGLDCLCSFKARITSPLSCTCSPSLTRNFTYYSQSATLSRTRSKHQKSFRVYLLAINMYVFPTPDANHGSLSTVAHLLSCPSETQHHRIVFLEMARIQDLPPEVLDVVAQNVHGVDLLAMRLCDKGSKAAADPYFGEEYIATRDLRCTKESFEHLVSITAHGVFKHWLESVCLLCGPGTFIDTDDATELLTEAFHNIARTGSSLRVGIYLMDDGRQIFPASNLFIQAIETTSVGVRGISIEMEWNDLDHCAHHDIFGAFLQSGNSWAHGVDLKLGENNDNGFRYISDDERLVLDQIPSFILATWANDLLGLPSMLDDQIIRSIEIEDCRFWPNDSVNFVDHFASNLSRLDMSNMCLFIDETTDSAHYLWDGLLQIIEELRLECSFSHCGFHNDYFIIISNKTFESVPEWREELKNLNKSVPDGGSMGELSEWNVDEENNVVGTKGTWHRRQLW